MILLVRYLLGIVLIIVGLNKFFGFLPPGDLNQEATAAISSLASTGYVLQMVGVTEILCGILLMLRASTPLALLLLAPLSVNILLFHFVHDPSTILLGALVALGNVYLAIKHFDYYRPIFANFLGERVTIIDRNISKSSKEPPIAEVS
ncbi:MAG: DoxX family membrane protein [Bdellovibrionales bacterium]|nr:DoxX family membrane protein [Bdellovibrionales bacterium]